jgi:signal transduction histidine kinase
MEQVLVNLIINALDAVADVPEGRLSVRTYRRDSTCFVEVADNGVGIQPHHMKRLFEPFFTTKPVGQGTGLGLEIARTRVRGHGGEIQFDSRPGRTEFRVSLPLPVPEATVTVAGPA